VSDVSVRLRPPAAGPLRVGHDASGGRVSVALIAAAAAAGALLLTPLYVELAVALAALAGALAWVVDGSVVAGKTVKIESQLADALDLLGSSVSAGVSVVEALDGVVRDVRMPLRRVLSAAADRLRLGDDPQRVLEDAEAALPLPGFRLLTQYLSVQWQSGGSIAPGMHAIAETVRDRVNLARRVQAQSAEARVSVLGILLIVYGIAALAWVNNPERIESFLGSDIGGGIAAACVLLQAAGIFWMARLTRIEV
jgi:tight adherence protein B